jgi:hypothetical protein
VRTLRAVSTASLLATYLFVAAMPCPPIRAERGEAPARIAASGHDEQAGAEASEDEHAGCHIPPETQLVPRCPCGCGDRAPTRTPGARLGFALIAQAPSAPPVPERRSVTPHVVVLPGPVFVALDPVPI